MQGVLEIVHSQIEKSIFNFRKH